MKEKILSIFRSILVSIGSYLTGKYLLGTELDDNTIAGYISLIVALAAAIWGWVDKTAGLEQVQSAVRNVLVAASALLIGIGILNDQTQETILLIAETLLASVWGVTSREQNKNIAIGKIKIADLSGVDPAKVDITPNTSPVKTK